MSNPRKKIDQNRSKIIKDIMRPSACNYITSLTPSPVVGLVFFVLLTINPRKSYSTKYFLVAASILC